MNRSSYRPVSIGIVAENKERDSKEIRVTPIEVLSDVADEITDARKEHVTRGVDQNGDNYRVSIARGVTRTATWAGETNRVTAPDVRRGEQVLLLQAADDPKLFWESMGRDDHLRRLETVVWAFNANPSNADAEPSEKNCYVYEVSTHDKLVTFSTSRANGEKAAYTSQYNTGDGIYTLTDDLGNFFYIDSVNTDILWKNGAGTFLRMNKEIFDLYSKTSYTLTTKNVRIVAENIDVTGTNSITFHTKTFAIDTKAFNIVAPDGTSIKGDVVFKGHLDVDTIKVNHITWGAKSGPC